MKVEILLNLLENIPEISYLRNESVNGIHATVYAGTKGNPVIIDTTDTEIDNFAVKGLFDELGLDPFYDDFIN